MGSGGAGGRARPVAMLLFKDLVGGGVAQVMVRSAGKVRRTPIGPPSPPQAAKSLADYEAVVRPGLQDSQSHDIAKPDSKTSHHSVPAYLNRRVPAFASGDKKKAKQRSAPIGSSHAAEVHNLAERRRRDKINKKLRTMQELLPRCNKSDKAPVLGEAIEYLKSLKLQVQMMSMGCNMGPMMFPGVQAFLPPMGRGMAVGMGTGMTMGGQRPFMPYTPIAGPAPSHLGPRPLISSLHSPNFAMADQVRVQAPSRQDPALNSASNWTTNMVRMPQISDPYHHQMGLGHLHASSRSRVMDKSGTSK